MSRSATLIGSGQCCDIGAKERVDENRQALKCKAAGLLAIKEKTWNGEKTYLGRNCSHNFCVRGSCQQGEFYAYCCTKESIVIDPYAPRPSQ